MQTVELYTTGAAGFTHINELDIIPSDGAGSSSLDNNIFSYDTMVLGVASEYRWTAGTKKINKCEIIISTHSTVTSATLDFYYIPVGETIPVNYIPFYTYNHAGGDLVHELVTAEMPRDYEQCDGICIIMSSCAGGGTLLIEEFDAYDYVGVKTISPHRNRVNAILSILDPLTTSLVFFKAINPVGGTGERNFSVYIKPLGIDTVWINNVDFNRYDLEVVLLNKDRQKSRFRTIPQAQTFSAHSKGDELGIPKSCWVQTDDKFNYTSGGWKRLPDAYFRLRDKTTKKVGRLSRAKIKPVYDHGDIPLKFIIV
jgi:hypothetical protein